MSRTGQSVDRLRRRLGELDEVIELAPGRLPPDVVDRLTATVERAKGRLGHGTAHTVVALAGPTGGGKSSTFNALAGQPVAAVGVRRPTTSSTQAVVFRSGDTGSSAAALLDWLGVAQRHVISDPELAGLVLLDLPDHDSTSVEHRREVDRLVHVVDVFVWVVDPQKYADAALHQGYLRRFAGHADVTIVVLNQLDTLPAAARRAALDDLRRLVVDDGMAVARSGLTGKLTGGGGVRLLGISTRTGEGMEPLRRELSARVAERRALVARLDADLDWIADDLAAATGEHDPRPVSGDASDRLAEAFAVAAGIPGVADTVADTHRIRGRQVAGWPPTRWITRLRPDPLRRLGLDRRSSSAAGDAASPARTSLPPATPVAAAGVAMGMRELVDSTTVGLPPLWRDRIGDIAASRRDDVDDALDRAVGTVHLPTDQPHWWSAARAAQNVLAAVMVVGVLWLILIGVVAWLRLPDLPAPEIGAVPWPTALALGGAAAGIILAAVARWATAVGARSRAASARRALTAATADVATQLVVAPVNDELATLADLRTLAARAR